MPTGVPSGLARALREEKPGILHQVRLRVPADKPESDGEAGPRTGPERTKVREDWKRRTGEPAARIALAQASFARRSPSREVRNPSRVPQYIVGRR